MKKYFKSYILFALMALTFAGCKTDDLKDDLDDLKDRVTLLEEQVKILNDNVEVLAYVLNPDNKTINRVIEEEDGAFTIVLSDNQELRLEIGSQGSVSEPSISVSEDGYWVINGEKTQNKAKGEDGDNLIPEFKIENGKWKVRFGEESEWQEVAGEYSVSEAGDQFFESAKVDGDNFVITDKDGENKYVMPIVAGLTCVINKENPAPTPSGYYEIKAGEKKDFDVEITGDGRPLAPIYPEGWRAELTPQTEAGKYTLTVYAPLSSTSTLSRATANNSEEVVVRANKGVFWAVDKIKVRLPKEYTSEKEKYDDGLPIEVNGFSIDPAVYGASKSLPEGNSISEGGVYFITDASQTSKAATEIALNIANGIDKLVIINEGTARPILKISNKQTLNEVLILDNVDISIEYTDDVFTVSENSSFIVSKSKISGLYISKSLITASSNVKMNLFSLHDSDLKINDNQTSSGNLYLLNGISCKKYEFINNIVAYNTNNNNTNELGDKAKLTNFKLFNNNTDGVIEELYVDANTFINIRSYGVSPIKDTNPVEYKCSPSGLFYVKYIGTSVTGTGNEMISSGAKIRIDNNIYYSALVSTKKISSMFVRYSIKQIAGEISLSNNIAYVNDTGGEFKYFYTSGQTNVVPDGLGEVNKYDSMKKEGIFDTSKGANYSFETFEFKPATEFSSYGAKR